MSGHRGHGCGCDPEVIFELADRALTPEQEQEVRSHLKKCPGCHEVYKRETNLNACLGSVSFSEPGSVREQVAMALPTRPVKARMLWMLLAGALLLISLFALSLTGANPAVFVMDIMSAFWSAAAMVADLSGTMLAAAGPFLLLALAVGAVLDLLLVVVLFSATRRHARQA